MKKVLLLKKKQKKKRKKRENCPPLCSANHSWIQTASQHDVNLMDQETSAKGLDCRESTFIRALERDVKHRKTG